MINKWDLVVQHFRTCTSVVGVVHVSQVFTQTMRSMRVCRRQTSAQSLSQALTTGSGATTSRQVSVSGRMSRARNRHARVVPPGSRIMRANSNRYGTSSMTSSTSTSRTQAGVMGVHKDSRMRPRALTTRQMWRSTSWVHIQGSRRWSK